MLEPALRDEPLITQLGPAAPYASELQFRRLLETLPAAAYTCDAEGLITYCNQHAVQLWGRAPSLNDPLDRFCGSFKLFSMDGAPIPHDQCWMALALATGQEYNGHEIIIERPDGRRVAALAHANPIRDERGALVGAVNVLIDITERKHTEDRLRQADQAKNEFLATLAHELRNPLAPIRNALQILHVSAPSLPELQYALGVIERQMQQMTRLTDDLLDLARISGDKLEVRKGRIELAEVLHTAVETSNPLIAAGAHDLTVTTPPGRIFLQGDLIRLSQVVSNLLNNAAKFTPRGGRIQLAAELHGGDAVIKVRDSGVGVPPDMLSRIFDMFTQVDRSLERCQGGLGVGLTLAKRIVDMHGGTLTARSEGVGTGSEFTVRLPAQVESGPRLPKGSLIGDVASAAPSQRVLVVDDNQDSAISLAMVLRLMGHEVRTAHDGLDALRVAEEFRPEAILLDIGLPRMNGYDVARTIRKQPWGRGPVMIAVTGWGQEADRRHSQEAGFDHHLVKPVEPAHLLQLLVQPVPNPRAALSNPQLHAAS